MFACLLAAGMALAIGAVAAGQRASLPDPLDTPTQPSDFARKGLASGIARSGDRLIAVGARGLILVSIDAAATWKQVSSPVSSDLVSVKFIDAKTAWAVGHDAVALRTTDGGSTWQKMLDGRAVLTLLRETYAARAKAGDAAAASILQELDRSMEQSASPDVMPSPFLDVWFADVNEGFLVGAFGLILHTSDGGKQWEPWIERVDNERRFHLYAMAGDGAERYIVGEQGLLLRLDSATKRFVKVETPYNGTYFGLDVRGARVVVFGLRGNAYVRAQTGGVWNKVETGIDANIVAAVNMNDDRLILVSQAGHLLAVASDLHKSSALKSAATGEVLGAVSSGPKSIALARVNGVATVEIASLNP